MLVIGGWTLFAHPLLLDQLDKLTGAVERERARNPEAYRQGANAKLLAAIRKLILEVVPADPARREYRQGSTLGAQNRHWFRAKFGNGRFRLFFRFDSRAKIIVFAWVNDETTLRTYGSRSDAYAVFRTMLDRGNPPGDMADLLGEASSTTSVRRFRAIADE